MDQGTRVIDFKPLTPVEFNRKDPEGRTLRQAGQYSLEVFRCHLHKSCPNEYIAIGQNRAVKPASPSLSIAGTICADKVMG